VYGKKISDRKFQDVPNREEDGRCLSHPIMAPKKKGGNSVAQPFVIPDVGLQAVVLVDEEDDCQLAPLTLDTPKVRKTM